MSDWRHDSQGPGGVSGGSIFDLPVSRGARAIRIVLILVLDAALAGAGIFMISSYLRGEPAPMQASAAPDAAIHGAVALVPSPVSRDTEVKRAAKPATAVATKTNARPEEPTKVPVKSPVASVDAQPAASPPQPVNPSSVVDAAPTATLNPTSTPDASVPVAASPDAAISASVDAGLAPGEPTADEVASMARRIRLVVNDHQQNLDTCYRQAAKVGNPEDKLQGKIVVRLAVEPNGTTSNVRTVENTTGSPDLAQCLVRLVRTWKMPEHPFEPLEFEWPFLFAPEES